MQLLHIASAVADACSIVVSVMMGGFFSLPPLSLAVSSHTTVVILAAPAADADATRSSAVRAYSSAHVFDVPRAASFVGAHSGW